PEPVTSDDQIEEELADWEYYYWVIAASVSEVEQAQQIIEQLEEYDLETRIHSFNDTYEVRIGPYEEVEEAEFEASRVDAFDFIDSVRVKIVLNR
ncbi:MAG: SPOR domain-containing protein, partial [Spirochaetota bacterium]